MGVNTLKYPTFNQAIRLIEGICYLNEELHMDLMLNKNVKGVIEYNPISDKQRRQIEHYMNDVWKFSHLMTRCGRENHKSDLTEFWEYAKVLKETGVTDIWQGDRGKSKHEKKKSPLMKQIGK